MSSYYYDKQCETKGGYGGFELKEHRRKSFQALSHDELARVFANWLHTEQTRNKSRLVGDEFALFIEFLAKYEDLLTRVSDAEL